MLEPAGALAIDALKDFPRKEITRQDDRLRRLRRQFRLRAAARRQGARAALRGAEEVFRLPLSAAAGRAARFPRTVRARRRHRPLRVSEEVGAQFRLGADRHRDEGPQEFRRAGETLPRSGLGLPGHHRQRDHCRAGDLMTVYIILFPRRRRRDAASDKAAARGADGGGLQGCRDLHQQRQRGAVVAEERRERHGRQWRRYATEGIRLRQGDPCRDARGRGAS